MLRGLFSPGTGVGAGEDVLRRGANGGIAVAVLAGSEASRLRFGDGLIVEMAVCGIFVSRMGIMGGVTKQYRCEIMMSCVRCGCFLWVGWARPWFVDRT